MYRQTISNATENINNVLAEFDMGLIDKRTALEKLENVAHDEIDVIMKRLEVERQTEANSRFPLTNDRNRNDEDVIDNA